MPKITDPNVQQQNLRHTSSISKMNREDASLSAGV
jgi:hypothetical protein